MAVDRIGLAHESGLTQDRLVVVHPGSVVALPIRDDGRIIMIRNRRLTAPKPLWELPAGTLEPSDSDPTAAVKRELVEETGYFSRQVRFLFDFRPSPGSSTEVMSVFLCTGLSPTEQQLEPFEDIEVHAVDGRDAIAMIHDGTICDGKSIATLLWYDRFIGSA